VGVAAARRLRAESDPHIPNQARKTVHPPSPHNKPRDNLADEIERLEWAIAHGPAAAPGERGAWQAERRAAVEALRARRQEAKERHSGMLVGGMGWSVSCCMHARALKPGAAKSQQLHNPPRPTHQPPPRPGPPSQRAYHEAFHPVWGRLLKTGYQNSRYAHQASQRAAPVSLFWGRAGGLEGA
jgi:hypothetical protein